jgi:hypothetical protein
MTLAAQDELEIRKLAVSYADAVSRSDPVQWAATWASDARWVLRTRTVTGRDEIVAQWKQFVPAYDSITQLVTSGWVEETADGAEGHWLILEIFRRAGAADDTMQVTNYTDRYVREQGRWLFAQRQLTVHYTRVLPAGEFFPWGRLSGAASR